jgi:hypothetical protein
VKFTFA